MKIDLTGALFTLSLGILKRNSQCEEGAGDVNVYWRTPVISAPGIASCHYRSNIGEFDITLTVIVVTAVADTTAKDQVWLQSIIVYLKYS